MSRRKMVLFICEGELHRSPSAAALYADAPGLQARSAGLSPLARRQVTDELLEWADIVFVMERRLLRMLRLSFGAALDGKEVVCLDVPDDYQFMEPGLLRVLEDRLTPYLGAPRPPASA